MFQASETSSADHITDYNVFEDQLHLDLADGETTDITITFENIDGLRADIVVGFGNGSTVTLDDMAMVDALFVFVDFV